MKMWGRGDDGEDNVDDDDYNRGDGDDLTIDCGSMVIDRGAFVLHLISRKTALYLLR